MPLRHTANQALTARATTTQPHHLGIGGGLVDEDQTGGIKHALFSMVDVTDVVKDIPRLGPQDVMRGVIERFDALKDRLVDAAAKGHGKPVSQVRRRCSSPRTSSAWR